MFCLIFVVEMGPLTLGYARWANLAPSVNELQSFGHCSVSENGDLEIKLIGIDGSVMFEKKMSPETKNDGIASEEESSGEDELPITTTDVFIQSGEVSDSSINIMARCNNEENSTVTLYIDGSEKNSAVVTADTDFTHTFVVGGLTSNTSYKYTVECTSTMSGSALSSMDGSFKTVPGAEEERAVSFVWAADLAGQGYGRNPDFEVTKADGTIVKGEIFASTQTFFLDDNLFRWQLLVI